MRKKRLISLVLGFSLVLGLTACGSSGGGTSAEATETPKATEEAVKEAANEVTDDKADTSTAADADIPESVQGNIKIAVIRNQPPNYHTEQNLAGCKEEGEQLGWTVDTFITNSDNEKIQEVVAQCIDKGYDGLIVSHALQPYAYDMLKPARDKGIAVVTNDSEPFDADGNILEGVTNTMQDDRGYAEQSIGYLLEDLAADGVEKPKFVKLFQGPGYPNLDRRDEVYTRILSEGKFEELEVVTPSEPLDIRGEFATKISAILPRYPKGSVDGFWCFYDEPAIGALQALNDIGRTDIKVCFTDVSDEVLNLMYTNRDVFRATSACDPFLLGKAQIRLMALKLAGEETPDEYILKSVLIKADDINESTTMENLSEVIKEWGPGLIDDLNRPWLDALKEKNGAS